MIAGVGNYVIENPSDLGNFMIADIRRRQVQRDHVGDLGDELGFGGELERLDPPRLHPIVTPRPGDRAVADPQVAAQQPRGPVRHPVLLRRRLQGRRDDPAVIHCARPTRARVIDQPVDPLRACR